MTGTRSRAPPAAPVTSPSCRTKRRRRLGAEGAGGGVAITDLTEALRRVALDDLSGYRGGSLTVLYPLVCAESWLAECRSSSGRERANLKPPEDRGPEVLTLA